MKRMLGYGSLLAFTFLLPSVAQPAETQAAAQPEATLPQSRLQVVSAEELTALLTGPSEHELAVAVSRNLLDFVGPPDPRAVGSTIVAVEAVELPDSRLTAAPIDADP